MLHFISFSQISGTMEKSNGGLVMFALLIAALLPVTFANSEGKVSLCTAFLAALPSSHLPEIVKSWTHHMANMVLWDQSLDFHGTCLWNCTIVVCLSEFVCDSYWNFVAKGFCTHLFSGAGDALYALRRSLTDPSNVLQSWDPTLVNPCTWFHVTCDGQNRVIRVYVQHPNLFDNSFWTTTNSVHIQGCFFDIFQFCCAHTGTLEMLACPGR